MTSVYKMSEHFLTNLTSLKFVRGQFSKFSKIGKHWLAICLPFFTTKNTLTIKVYPQPSVHHFATNCAARCGCVEHPRCGCVGHPRIPRGKQGCIRRTHGALTGSISAKSPAANLLVGLIGFNLTETGRHSRLLECTSISEFKKHQITIT